ncbi:hypothetical protein [Nonomuraea sp. NPDC049784]
MSWVFTSVACRAFGSQRTRRSNHSRAYGDCRSMETVAFHAKPAAPI